MTRESMIFPFRWARSLSYLDDADFRRMVTAIIAYAEMGEEPKFSGALGAVWTEIQQRIDADTGKYVERCERNRDNAKKRWDANACERMQTDANRCQPIPKHTKNTDADADADADLKKKPPIGGKEKPGNPASTTTGIIESSILPIADFGKWSKEQFTRSVTSAVADHPEYSAVVDAFSQYWLEPDRRGRFRFALEKTWSTAGRLATWFKRESPARSSQPPTSGWHRDPKTGVVRGISDEEQILEFRKREGF